VLTDVLPDLTVPTDQGPVDLVAIERWLGGDYAVSLTDPELRLAYEASRAGRGPSYKRFQLLTGKNPARLLAQPVPVDRQGRLHRYTEGAPPCKKPS
jgi:hypothetical protein